MNAQKKSKTNKISSTKRKIELEENRKRRNPLWGKGWQVHCTSLSMDGVYKNYFIHQQYKNQGRNKI